METGENNELIVGQVIEKLQNFYNAGTDETGEDIFNKFAAKHAHLFTAEASVEGCEQRLEWTACYKEFSDIFESHIECEYSSGLTPVCCCRVCEGMRVYGRGLFYGLQGS